MKMEKPGTLTVQNTPIAWRVELKEREKSQSATKEEVSKQSSVNRAVELSDTQEKNYYMVWETELGARIYKVPEGKLDALQGQSHSDKFKVLDNLKTAKTEAIDIFKKVSEKRLEKGLPPSILEPVLKDLSHWNEHDVPSYFL